MIQQVYSIRDCKAGVFGRPIFTPNAAVLIRELQDMLTSSDPHSRDLFMKHPEDFELYRLGDFDDVKGTFDLLPLPDFFLHCTALMPAGHAGASAPVTPAGEAGQDGSSLVA